MLDFNSIFVYIAETGTLVWKSGRLAGHVAGTTLGARRKYRVVRYMGRVYYVHKVVWSMVNGRWPAELDHINNNSMDNRICNLREVTKSENMLNKGLQSNNTSGEKGISYRTSTDTWILQMRKVGKKTVIKEFKTFEEAVTYKNATCEEYYGNTYRRS